MSGIAESIHCCEFCGGPLVGRVNKQPKTRTDKAGCVRAIEPITFVDYFYYECGKCGMRYTKKEIER